MPSVVSGDAQLNFLFVFYIINSSFVTPEHQQCSDDDETQRGEHHRYDGQRCGMVITGGGVFHRESEAVAPLAMVPWLASLGSSRK